MVAKGFLVENSYKEEEGGRARQVGTAVLLTLLDSGVTDEPCQSTGHRLYTAAVVLLEHILLLPP